MTIWIALWLVLSAALLFFMSWTILILFRQKRSWKSFAARHKLRMKETGVFSSPEISGVMRGFSISLFTSEHTSRDARGSRKLTAIEIQLSGRLPAEGAAASGGMIDIARSFGFTDEWQPDESVWEKGTMIATNNKRVAKAYYTQPRLTALAELMKEKGAWVIFVHREDVTLLRIDTPSALETESKLDRLVQKMLDAASALEVDAAESSRLKAEALKQPVREVSLEIDEKLLQTGSGFELESDT